MTTILVVEDNPDNMSLCDEILSDAGYNIEQAFNAEDGLQLLNNRKIDLVLMDVSLPIMNGLDATRKIKSDPELKRIHVIILTALAMKSDEINAYDAGCDGFLTKPIDEDILLESISNILKNDDIANGIDA